MSMNLMLMNLKNVSSVLICLESKVDKLNSVN